MPTRANTEGSSAAARRPTVLVVNDTPEILDLFRELLEEEGYEVFLWSYAAEDLTEIKKMRPDVIVLDLIMNNEDRGWQLLQKLRMDRATARVPIVVCSAAVKFLEEIDGHLKRKNVGVVLKPFDIDELITAIDDVRRTASATLDSPSRPLDDGTSAS